MEWFLITLIFINTMTGIVTFLSAFVHVCTNRYLKFLDLRPNLLWLLTCPVTGIGSVIWLVASDSQRLAELYVSRKYSEDV